MKRLALALLLLPIGLEAQVADTVFIDVVGAPVQLIRTCTPALESSMLQGSETTCVLRATDVNGDPAPSVFTVTSTPSQAVTIQQTNDSTFVLSFPTIASNVQLVFDAQPRMAMHFGVYTRSQFALESSRRWWGRAANAYRWLGEPGGEGRLCAYREDAGELIAKSWGGCPEPAYLGEELPVERVEWSEDSGVPIEWLDGDGLFTRVAQGSTLVTARAPDGLEGQVRVWVRNQYARRGS